MPKYSQDQIRKLPPEARAQFYDGDAAERMAEEVYPRVPQGNIGALNEAILDVYFRVLSVGEFLERLKPIVPDPAIYRGVAAGVLGNSFLPISDYLNADVAGMILELGGDVNLYKKLVPVGDVIAKVLDAAEIDERDDDHLEKRLLSIVESILLQVRKPEQALAVLTGSPKTNGVGLTEEEAKRLVAASEEERKLLEKRHVVVISDAEYERLQQVTPAAKPELSSPEVSPSPSVTTPQSDTTPVVVPPPVPKPPARAPVIDAPTAADAAEVAALAAPKAQQVNNAGLKSFEHDLDALIRDSLAICGPVCTDAEMERRFKILVESYFHDLRDDIELRARLELAPSKGGLGLPTHETEEIVTRLSHRKRDFQGRLRARAETQRAAFVAERTKSVLESGTNDDANEKRELDSLYDSLLSRTGVKQKNPDGTARLVEPPKPQEPKVIRVVSQDTAIQGSRSVVTAAARGDTAPAVRTIPIVSTTAAPANAIRNSTPSPMPPTPPPSLPVKPDVSAAGNMPSGAPKPTPPTPPAKPAAPMSAPAVAPAPRSQTPPMPTPPPAQKLPTPPMAAPKPMPLVPPKPATPSPAPLAAPKPAAVVPPRPVAPPPKPAPAMPPAKPTMSDVKFTPRLVGPVEELRGITLADFRKLSREPKEATLKLKDKIDLLEDTSYEMKSQGIRAWQESEPNRVYLELLRESFEGVPLADIIAKREADNQPSLTKDEFAAILELNSQLRFG